MCIVYILFNIGLYFHNVSEMCKISFVLTRFRKYSSVCELYSLARWYYGGLIEIPLSSVNPHTSQHWYCGVLEGSSLECQLCRKA